MNSKKLYKKAAKHVISLQHRASVALNSSSYGTTTVAEKINIQSKTQTEEAELITKNLFRAAYFLFSLEIPHTTTWRPLMSTIAALDSSGSISQFFKNAPANAHHLTAWSITDILHSFTDAIFEASRKEFSSVGDFAVVADESTDVNGNEILSIYIRYIKQSQVIERFMCAVPIVSTTAESIYSELLEQKQTYCPDSTRIAAASFDGASNFSGIRDGIGALLALV